MVFKPFFFTHPPRDSNFIRIDIRFEIPSFTHPPRGGNVVRIDIRFEIPSLPPRGGNIVRIDIRFEIPSFTHPLEVVILFRLIYGLKCLPLLTPLEVVILFGLKYSLKCLPLLTPLEVVMLFGPENLKVNTIAAVYTFYLNLKLFKRSTSLNYKCSRVWG